MEFMTGVNKKDTVEISEILAGDFEGNDLEKYSFLSAGICTDAASI